MSPDLAGGNFFVHVFVTIYYKATVWIFVIQGQWFCQCQYQRQCLKHPNLDDICLVYTTIIRLRWYWFLLSWILDARCGGEQNRTNGLLMRVTNSGKAAVAPNRNSSSEKKCSVEINSIETNSSHFKNFTLSLISLIHLDIGKDSALQHWKGKSFAIKISFPRKVITWICMDWIHMVGGTRSARKAFMCQTFSLLSCSSFKTFNPLWQKRASSFHSSKKSILQSHNCLPAFGYGSGLPAAAG